MAETGANCDDVTGVDVGWYYRTFRDSSALTCVAACLSDYLANAGLRLRSPNLAFDELWYRDRYPQVEEMVRTGRFSSGWQHYLCEGAQEGFNPAFWFDEHWYQKNHPEAYAALANGSFICGFEHFALRGIHDDLSPSLYFNPRWYRDRLLCDTCASGKHRIPIVHYLLMRSGSRPCPVPFFDSDWYAKQYLRRVMANSHQPQTPYEHYIFVGRRLGYSPSPFFNETAYRDRYPDVVTQLEAGTYLTGFEHYVNEGLINGYIGSSHLDTAGADYCGPAFVRAFGQSLNLNVTHIADLRDLLDTGNDQAR